MIPCFEKQTIGDLGLRAVIPAIPPEIPLPPLTVDSEVGAVLEEANLVFANSRRGDYSRPPRHSPAP